MPKKRVVVEVGSLMDPIFKYVIELNLIANPVDSHGTSILRYFMIIIKLRQLVKQTMFLDKRVHQANFQCNYKESLDCRSSIMEVKFCKIHKYYQVNGWERRFFLWRADMGAIYQQIYQYNHFIEGIRALKGEDDEPEDEWKTL
ncbi:hypothetical protein pb186bvf_020076 [Paramecium bursaria]